ncbi:MAG: nucleotide exchange factor GrpE [Nitrospinaceae bacterium]
MSENSNSEHPSQPTEKPKITVVDRRHSAVSGEELAAGDQTAPDERYPSYVEKLRKEAEEKDKRLREYIAAYKEKNSETDEFRQRLQRENEARLDQFKANLFARLVPILDNLKRAANSATQTSDFDSLKEGIQLVIQQYIRELEENNVTVIDTRDVPFDPKLHEAFMVEETQDPEMENRVLEELEPGYMYKDKLIKAAKVKIARLKS